MTYLAVERESVTLEGMTLLDFIEDLVKQTETYWAKDFEMVLGLAQYTAHIHTLHTTEFPEFQLDMDFSDVDIHPEDLQRLIRNYQLRTFPDPDNLTDAERAQLLFVAYNDRKEPANVH